MRNPGLLKANILDATALHAVQLRAFRREAAFYGGEYVPPPGIDSVEWHERMMREALYFKITWDEAIIGGLVLIQRGETCMELRSLFVDEDMQCRGAGSAAIQSIESEFPAVTRWLLATPYRSTQNQRFYERRGYVKAGETKPLSPSGFRLFLYAKQRGTL